MKTIPVITSMAAAVAFIATLTGCNSSTGTISRDPVSYIKITGINQELTAQIDGGALFALVASKGSVSVQVPPGKHRIKIMHGAEVIVDRVFMVSDLQSLELPVQR